MPSKRQPKPARTPATAGTCLGLFALALVACGPAARAERPAAPSPSAARSVPTNTPPPEPEAAQSDDRFAVAGENASAVEVARAILERGGSASDAAVAGLLTGCAAHAASCGLGGGGEALLYQRSARAVVAIDFREVAPSGIKRQDYLSRTPPKKKRGLMIGVPGFVAGLWALHQRGGKLPWKTVVEAAIEPIEKGLPLSPYAAQTLVWSAKWIADEGLEGRLGPRDPAAAIGEPVAQPALVATLRVLAERGRDGFYEGDVARDVVDRARAAGSRMTTRDLSEYREIVREPLELAWEGHRVLVAPPSSGAGVAQLQLLAMFSRDDLKKLGAGSGSYVHLVAEGLRAAYADRATTVGDPAFTKADARGLFDVEKMKARRDALKLDATNLPKIPGISESGTFTLVVVDAGGDSVVVTASLTDMFGAKVLAEGGFALNDTLTDFATDDYGQRAYTRGPNFARGGARPVSNLAPTLVIDDGEVTLALGASGGLRGLTSVVQVLFNRLAFDLPLPEAVSDARFHVAAGGNLKLDPDLAGLGADLVARGEVVEASAASFGAVTAVGATRERGLRLLQPVFDPRKGGAVTVGHGDATPKRPVTERAPQP